MNNKNMHKDLLENVALGIEEEEVISEEVIEQPYDPSRIQVDPKSMTIFQVMRKILLREINLQPEFQRNIVWDDTRQSRLIESILIRIPLPAFYLDAVNDNEWLVVDGLQRFWTLDRFYNKKELKLQNLEFLEDQIGGKNFDELPRKLQRDIEETLLYLYIIRPDTPAEVKFTVFYRINTGGMVLSAQEIRHCLFQGKSTRLLKELGDSKPFLEATTSSINTKRMDDRECVLRFFAFYLTPYTQYKNPDLNKFLSNAMIKINEIPDSQIKDLKDIFKNAMNKSKLVFGRYAFRKMFDRSGYRYPINKSLFEIWSVCLQKFNENTLENHKDRIIDSFIHTLNGDYDYQQSISQGTGGVKRIHYRFRKTLEIIEEALR